MLDRCRRAPRWIDDHRDVFVTAAGVASKVFIDPAPERSWKVAPNENRKVVGRPPERLRSKPAREGVHAGHLPGHSADTTDSHQCSSRPTTARSESRRCPVTSSPNSSSQQKVIKSAQANFGAVRLRSYTNILSLPNYPTLL